MKAASLIRYGEGPFELRTAFIKLCAWLQGKEAVILDSDPIECARALASSETKGSFIETIFAIPAWRPLYSIESEDGTRWKALADSCSKVLRGLRWKESMVGILDDSIKNLAVEIAHHPHRSVDSETISRLVLRTLYQVLFDTTISAADETLFFQGSIEWRKEIAVKGKGDEAIKKETARRLMEIVSSSKYRDGLQTCPDPMMWLSVFGQPFIISPQINVSDIMVATFFFLRKQPEHYQLAREKALNNDGKYLHAVIMEAIRLQHPFPILERELTRDLQLKDRLIKAGTQIFIPLDQFKQDQSFHPDAWLNGASPHPYQALVFGAGKRMCLGKMLASHLMVEMLRSLLIHIPDSQIQPDKGHRFSGRNNDGNQSFGESSYQLRKFLGALWRSYKIGRQAKKRIQAV
ncbi:cytochrome P450 [Oligoflexus tunisiensis]|uniref:cytochrome P450 n=1 Tax=Oligoflexus tunisiensis TaxID=708132 RepID=UPI00114D0BFA|nr:cytochrome P450 [Oligoflexus tunisiensis]